MEFQFWLELPRAIRRRIMSKLYELNTVLDAGRGGWCRKKGASTAALVAEIHALSLAFDGPTSMYTHTRRTHGQIGEVRTSILNIGTR